MPESPPSILVIAPFDDAEHAHSAQRARALERLGCDVTNFDLLKRPGLLGRLAGSDLRSRILKAVEAAEAKLVLVIGGYELDESLVDSLNRAIRSTVRLLPNPTWRCGSSSRHCCN